MKSLLTWLPRRASSIRVNLEFREQLDAQFFLEGLDARIIRLMGRVRFRTPVGWSTTERAIIDPGSPNCIVPNSVWKAAEHRIVIPRPVPLGGIGSGMISAPIGEVTLVVHDDVIISPALTVRGFLLPDDSEPLLLGFQDFLTATILYCDYERRNAYIEFRLG